MIKSFALIILSSVIGFAQQNLQENYIPLKSSGALPDIFTQNIRNVITSDINDLYKQKETDKLIKQTYLTEANYEIEKIVKSGNTLINDEITVYLNKIADELLKNNPTLRQQLHIYTLKSHVVNAYSYDKGYVFIDIGLIAQAETEAQLAYILCHEISHFTKKHHINGYVKNEKIDNKSYNGQSSEDKLIEKCQYSKEFESEADLEGFKLFEQSNYNLKQAQKAFDVLQYSHLPFELVEFKKTFFETEKFIIPQGYFLKEVSSIRNNSNEDDTKQTHPNTAKRKQAITELISNRSNDGRVNALVNQKEFEYTRDLSRMELCRLYLKNRDYPSALYAAYILNIKYPNNQYVSEIIAKCLYGLSLHGNSQLSYTHDSYLENGIPGHSDVESYPQQLYHLINKMPSNEFTIMSLNYVYRAHKKFPTNKFIESYSDSLFKLVGQVNWNIFDFVRLQKKEIPKTEIVKDSVKKIEETNSKTDLIANLQKENNFKNYDTAYYKEVYLDLFLNDKEFTSKFPSSGLSTNTGSGFSNYDKSNSKSYKKKKKGEYISSGTKITKVLLLEPFYVKVDITQKEKVQYVEADKKQEKLITIINDCAKRQNFELVTLDPGLLTTADVDKMNDYSILNDWFDEKFDANDNDRNTILNTNEIENVVSKYGTRYVLKTGIVSYVIGLTRNKTYFYSFIYDLKTKEVVYKKYEAFSEKDSQTLLYAKVYQTFYELIHSK